MDNAFCENCSDFMKNFIQNLNLNEDEKQETSISVRTKEVLENIKESKLALRKAMDSLNKLEEQLKGTSSLTYEEFLKNFTVVFNEEILCKYTYFWKILEDISSEYKFTNSRSPTSIRLITIIQFTSETLEEYKVSYKALTYGSRLKTPFIMDMPSPLYSLDRSLKIEDSPVCKKFFEKEFAKLKSSKKVFDEFKKSKIIFSDYILGYYY